MTINIEESLQAAHRQHAEGAVKTWEDLERYAAIMERDKPELIIECGSFSGGSAAWFSRYAPVITIDIDDSHLEERHMANWNNVTFLHGSTTDPDVVNSVRALAKGKRCFVVLDSDHSGPHVYNEILAYQDLVHVGCHMTVEDTLVRWMSGIMATAYDGSPLDAVERLLAESDEWVLDTDIEDMHTQSQHVGGWLKRVK